MGQSLAFDLFVERHKLCVDRRNGRRNDYQLLVGA